MRIERVGVVGSGLMGSGIAIVSVPGGITDWTPPVPARRYPQPAAASASRPASGRTTRRRRRAGRGRGLPVGGARRIVRENAFIGGRKGSR